MLVADFRLSKLSALSLLAIVCSLLWSCDKNDDDSDVLTAQEEACYYRYWHSYPNSYIKMCDWRLNFRFIRCERVDGGLVIEYIITNTGFDKKVKVGFCFPENRVAAHDDLGNTYKVEDKVTATIDGRKYSYYGWGVDVTFMPNQAIKGQLMIKDFDHNAHSVSAGIHVGLNEPKDETLMYDWIEFVNLPIDGDIDDLEHM